MKVVFVVDTVENLNKKVHMLETHFGNDFVFIVKANLAPLFSTFGYSTSAVYTNNLTKVMHITLLRLNVSNLVVCYASVNLSNQLLDEFTAQIDDGNKLVNVLPMYNTFEQMCNGAYNVYVKSIFKTHDSMISPKLQYLPELCVKELLDSHMGNRLFEIDERLCHTIYVQDKPTNKSLKVKAGFNKFAIIPIIVALAVTALLIMGLAFWGAKYLVIFVAVLLYILDIFLSIIFQCKNYFDARFFR